MRPLRVGGRVLVVGAILVAVTLVAALSVVWRSNQIDPTLTRMVQRGTLTSQLTTSGILRPIESVTYRSPVPGRELEIVELVPEGTRVKEGDLLVRLDATELHKEADRLRQEVRELQMDLQVAHAERQEAEAAMKMVAEGEGALTVEEARMRLQLAQNKFERLQREHADLKPLMEKGFITRDELARTSSELEQAQEEFALARKRHDVIVQLTHPREKQRAALQLAQRLSRLENIVGRIQETEARVQQTAELANACEIRARRPGLVVYEQMVNSSPRRKIRVGDRVSPSQGLVTIPEVNRMLVEASVTEAEVHRVAPGQTATVRLEAFPSARLAGRVVRVGTLASSSVERPFDEKRFDLIIELFPTDIELRPEMTARADIILGTRSNVLLIPVNAVFEREGAYVAHVMSLSGPEARPLTLGESNAEFVEVLGGLAENDRVLLMEPNAPSAPPPGAAPSTTAPAREMVNGGSVP